MKKFLVLNFMYQAMNPYAYGFKQQPKRENQNAPAIHTPEDCLFDEDEAKKFAEHMATLQIGQTFHVVEVKAMAKAKPPIEWT